MSGYLLDRDEKGDFLELYSDIQPNEVIDAVNDVLEWASKDGEVVQFEYDEEKSKDSAVYRIVRRKATRSMTVFEKSFGPGR